MEDQEQGLGTGNVARTAPNTETWRGGGFKVSILISRFRTENQKFSGSWTGGWSSTFVQSGEVGIRWEMSPHLGLRASHAPLRDPDPLIDNPSVVIILCREPTPQPSAMSGSHLTLWNWGWHVLIPSVAGVLPCSRTRPRTKFTWSRPTPPWVPCMVGGGVGPPMVQCQLPFQQQPGIMSWWAVLPSWTQALWHHPGAVPELFGGCEFTG